MMERMVERQKKNDGKKIRMTKRRMMERRKTKRIEKGWIDRRKNTEKKGKRKRYSVLLTCYNQF